MAGADRFGGLSITILPQLSSRYVLGLLEQAFKILSCSNPSRARWEVAQMLAYPPAHWQHCPHFPLIPTCTLRGHSKMGKIGHGVKKLRIVLKSLQLVTKGINHGIKGGKDTVRKSFFP